MRVQIVETMPQTAQVEEFVDKLGFFYGSVDNAALPAISKALVTNGLKDRIFGSRKANGVPLLDGAEVMRASDNGTADMLDDHVIDNHHTPHSDHHANSNGELNIRDLLCTLEQAQQVFFISSIQNMFLTVADSVNVMYIRYIYRCSNQACYL